MTDATLVQLATYCPRINTLVLSHCDQITDEGITRLVGGLCGPQQLQRLAMDNCPLLTDSSLEMLGSVCQNLCQVDLYDCQLITRQGIENLKVRGRMYLPPRSCSSHRECDLQFTEILGPYVFRGLSDFGAAKTMFAWYTIVPFNTRHRCISFFHRG